MSAGAALWLLLTWLWLCLAPLASPSPSALPKSAQDPEAWFILDQADQGSSVLLRRITPKSVFVAPTLGCSHGYQEDALGRCIKTVKVDQASQWDFYLKRLQSMFAPTVKKPPKEEQPFHINLPIGSGGGDSRPEADSPTVSKRRPGDSWSVKTTTQPTTTSTTTTTTTTAATTTETEQETEGEASISLTLPQLEVTSERELELQTSFTSENKVPAFTEGSLQMVMLADQPAVLEETTEPTTETPNHHDFVRQSEKPFIIIVTNETTTKPEETYPPSTTFVPQNTEEDSEEIVSEATSMEVSTEVTTETTPRIWTDSTSIQTNYDEQLNETQDTVETSIRPAVRDETPPSEVGYDTTSTTERYKPPPVPVQFELPSTTVRYEVLPTINPPVRYSSSTECSPDRVNADGFSECEPQGSEVKSERATSSPLSLPPNMPLLEPNVQVRFPSESYVPVRKTQSYVRFPEVTNPHDDRPSMWYPQWQVRQHPDIHGWPPSDDRPSFPHHHTSSWADHTAWRRRFFSQRD